ncbi:MAG: ATP-binding protein [Lachnospiraceae bacterium]|nr:ATP-binding protein [Lachnospiraceae bacterium]
MREEKIFRAEISEFESANDFLNEFLEKNDCPMKIAINVSVAFEELFVNVASYAYPEGSGDVKVTLVFENNRVSVTLADKGIEYNPLIKEDPDVTLNADERPIGGLGIFMVKKMMDDISYEYADGENRITFAKGI